MSEKMSVIDTIEQALRAHPEGLSRQEISQGLAEQGVKVPATTIKRRLTDLQTNNKAWRDDDGIWHAGETVEEEKPPVVSVPGAYDEFRKIGQAVGMQESAFLDAICDYVFSGNTHDLNWVWEALSSMYLGRDITPRWFRLWSMAIKQPIPEELVEKVGKAEKPGAEATAEKRRLRYTVAGNRLFIDPDGEFDTPQAALNFIEANRALSAQPSSPATDAAEMVRAIGELGKGTQTTMDVAAIMQAMADAGKPNYADLLAVIQALQPGPTPERPDTLSKVLEFLRTSPDAISSTLGMIRRALGIDQLDSKITSIGSQPAPVIKLGEGGLNLPDYKDLIGFIGDQRRAESEEKRRDEAHQAKLGFWGEIRERGPQVLSAAERAVARMESKAATRQAPTPPPKPAETFQAPCPQCKTLLTGPPESVVECPGCKTPVLLTQKAPPKAEEPPLPETEAAKEE